MGVGDGTHGRRCILDRNPKEPKRSWKRGERPVELPESVLSRHKDRDATAKGAIEPPASERFERYLAIANGPKSESAGPRSKRPEYTTASGRRTHIPPPFLDNLE